jgi:hypothetical protein
MFMRYKTNPDAECFNICVGGMGLKNFMAFMELKIVAKVNRNVQ